MKGVVFVVVVVIVLFFNFVPFSHSLCPGVVAECDCALDVIKCGGKAMTTIPAFNASIGRKIWASLRFDFNAISILRNSAFVNVKTKVIDFEQNSLVKVEDDAFQGLESTLETLNLRRNRLTSIPFAIRGLTSLRDLDLSANGILSIEAAAFTATALSRLNLAHNAISALDSAAFAAVAASLAFLDLTGNRVQVFPARALAPLKNLVALDLQDNLIRFVPIKSLSGMKSLRRLNLAENKIYGFHYNAIFGASTTPIVFFDVSNNALSSINVLRLMLLHGNNGTGISEIRLGKNPFLCDCRLLNLVNWLRAEPIIFKDAEFMKCSAPDRLKGKSFPEIFLRENSKKPEEILDEETRCLPPLIRPTRKNTPFSTPPPSTPPPPSTAPWEPNEHMAEARVIDRSWTSLDVELNFTRDGIAKIKGFQLCWRAVDGNDPKHKTHIHEHQGEVCDGEDESHRCSHCMRPDHNDVFMITRLRPGIIYEICKHIYFANLHKLKKCIYEDTEDDMDFQFMLIGGGIGLAIVCFILGAIFKFILVAHKRKQKTMKRRKRILLRPEGTGRRAAAAAAAGAGAATAAVKEGGEDRGERRNGYLINESYHPHHATSMQTAAMTPSRSASVRSSHRQMEGRCPSARSHRHSGARSTLGRQGGASAKATPATSARVTPAASTRTINSDCASTDSWTQTTSKRERKKDLVLAADWKSILSPDAEAFDHLFYLTEIMEEEKKV